MWDGVGRQLALLLRPLHWKKRDALPIHRQLISSNCDPAPHVRGRRAPVPLVGTVPAAVRVEGVSGGRLREARVGHMCDLFPLPSISQRFLVRRLHHPPRSPDLNLFLNFSQGNYNFAIVCKDFAGALLTWKDLTVTIKGKRKYSEKVMKSSNGYALPRTITVIMGPAKSGKSTLLRALAGRLPHSARMYGEVFCEWLKVAHAVWFIPGVVLLSSICPAHYLKKSSPSRSENATSTPSRFFRRPFPPPFQRSTSRPDFLLQTFSRC
ncbi:hypothetical protein EV1_040119 [Malus domestica]